MCKIWFSSLFTEEITQRKAREFLIGKSFRLFGFSQRFSNGRQLFYDAQIFRSGLQTQRQQFLGFLELACASLQFSETQGGRSAKVGQPQSFAVSVSRLLLAFEPFIGNYQKVRNYRVTSTSPMNFSKPGQSDHKSI